MPRDTPSNEIDTFAYAFSFRDAAKKVSSSEVWDDNAPMVVPFYLLIGFSVENCLKAALEFKAHNNASNWTHSHDLAHLRKLANQCGLHFQTEVIDFVDHLSPLHRQHQFRYPQKAERAELLKPEPALQLTDLILGKTFEFINGPSRMAQKNTAP